MSSDLKKVSFAEVVSRLELGIVNQVSDLDSLYVQNLILSDLMSDVLMVGHDVDLLVTSLATDQSIRTASIMDMSGVIIVNGKEVTENMRALAEELGINLFSSHHSKYHAGCLLYDLQEGR